MKLRRIWAAALVVLAPSLLSAVPAAALTLSSNELVAAEQLGCVLADDALGYLDENQFNERFDAVVDTFSDDKVDVIYAKALGYIDGLLFGLSGNEQSVANRRLEAYSNSSRCDSVTARTASFTLSL